MTKLLILIGGPNSWGIPNLFLNWNGASDGLSMAELVSFIISNAILNAAGSVDRVGKVRPSISAGEGLRASKV